MENDQKAIFNGRDGTHDPLDAGNTYTTVGDATAAEALKGCPVNPLGAISVLYMASVPWEEKEYPKITPADFPNTYPSGTITFTQYKTPLELEIDAARKEIQELVQTQIRMEKLLKKIVEKLSKKDKK